MKKLKYYLAVFAFSTCLLFVETGLAQKFSFGDVYNRTTFLKEFNVGSDVQGSPYIQTEFTPAKIADSDVLYGIRYNALNDQIEVNKDGEAVALPMVFNYDVVLSSSGKTYRVYSTEDIDKGFFVVLSEAANFKLLAKESVKYQEAVPTNGIQLYKPAQFIQEKNKYYIGYKSNRASQLPSKKKEFYALFGKYSQAISEYIKTNKLNIKKELDLIKIFNFYSTLKAH